MGMKNYIQKNLSVFIVFILLLVGAFSGNAKAASAFLKNQSYNFGVFTISGVDGTLALFKHYSTTQYFRVIAYQIADGKIDNSVHILAVIDNSGMPWGDIATTDVNIEVVSTATVSSTNSVITSGTPGYVDILQNGDITVPDGAQTIKLQYTLGFTDGSIMNLESEIKLNVL
jgi:hypothetical protein